MDILIKTLVIATNNGRAVIEKLLNSLINIDYNERIAIIDTQSNDIGYIDYLNTLKEQFKELNITIYQTPYSGRDSGAYMYSINNINSDYYYFMQDSMEIKSKDFFNEFDKIIENGSVATLVTFPPKIYDSKAYWDFCQKNYGTSEYKNGIFGPTFGISKVKIDEIDKSILVYPTNRTEQEAMERGWAVLFEKYNIEIQSIEGIFDDNKLRNDGHKLFKKTFLCRP